MKNRRLLNQVFFLLLLVVTLNCSDPIKSIDIESIDLIKLFEDSSYSNTIIQKWQLEDCSSILSKRRFCYRDSIIVYNILGDEHMFTFTNIEVKNIDKLISNLQQSYNEIDLKDNERYDYHIQRKDIDFAKYFYDDSYGFTLGKIDTKENQIFTITVSKGSL